METPRFEERGAQRGGSQLIVQAVLGYRPTGLGDTVPVIPLGATDNPRVLRALRDALVEQARTEARVWQDVDPGIFTAKAAEFERLCRILSVILPDEELKPDLRVLKGRIRNPPPTTSAGREE